MRGNIPQKTISSSCWHTHTHTHTCNTHTRSMRNVSFILMRFQSGIIKSSWEEQSRITGLPDILLILSAPLLSSPKHLPVFSIFWHTERAILKSAAVLPHLSFRSLLRGMRRKRINVPSVCINHISADTSDSRLNCLRVWGGRWGKVWTCGLTFVQRERERFRWSSLTSALLVI